MKIAPSILSFDLANPSDYLPGLEQAGASAIHLDVMDGQFVPPITFGDAYVRSLRPLVKTLFEVHLMTLTPERHFRPFVDAGCRRIIFHAEATVHAHRLIQELHALDVEAGMAINPATPVDALLPIIDDLDLALVMTVNPGWGSQMLIPSALDKVRLVRAARQDLLIEVDGGVDPETIRGAQNAGATLAVVGSYLAKSHDLQGAMKSLEEACS